MSDDMKTLLVVDDEDDVRESICELLEFELDGYKIIEASSGNQAFEMFQKGEIDFVVSDIKMTDGDGIQLLEKIRESDPEMPVVVLITGFSMITKEEALKKGARDLIMKPFDVKKLAQLILSES